MNFKQICAEYATSSNMKNSNNFGALLNYGAFSSLMPLVLGIPVF